nr:2599_t:CDS:10 [Entrophospora candida]
MVEYNFLTLSSFEETIQEWLSFSTDSSYRYSVRNHYLLQKIGDSYVVLKKSTSCGNGDKPLLVKEDLYKVFCEAHLENNHGGQSQTWKNIKKNWDGVKQDLIEQLVKKCTTCASRRNSVKPNLAAKPILASGFMSRLQVDLVDFSSQEDNGHKYVLHAKDHFTRFSWGYPMKTKSSKEVANHLFDLFMIFGAPTILQSDNGKEFKSKDIIIELKNIWPNMKIINGRPRHPQSQGSVECGNQTLKYKLGAWMQDNNCSDWTFGLKFIIHSMNTSESGATKYTPYNMVFGTKHKENSIILNTMFSKGITDEENIPDDVLIQDNGIYGSENNGRENDITVGNTDTDNAGNSDGEDNINVYDTDLKDVLDIHNIENVGGSFNNMLIWNNSEDFFNVKDDSNKNIDNDNKTVNDCGEVKDDESIFYYNNNSSINKKGKEKVIYSKVAKPQLCKRIEDELDFFEKPARINLPWKDIVLKYQTLFELLETGGEPKITEKDISSALKMLYTIRNNKDYLISEIEVWEKKLKRYLNKIEGIFGRGFCKTINPKN